MKLESRYSIGEVVFGAYAEQIKTSVTCPDCLGQREWAFRDAVVCNKVGHASIHVANGPNIKMEKTLTCWRGISK